MTALVIHSYAALSWCFEDEASPQTDALFERVRDLAAAVPGLWHLEVANVLQAEKRRRITAGDVTMRLDLIAALPIATDSETTARAAAPRSMPSGRRRHERLDRELPGLTGKFPQKIQWAHRISRELRQNPRRSTA